MRVKKLDIRCYNIFGPKRDGFFMEGNNKVPVTKLEKLREAEKEAQDLVSEARERADALVKEAVEKGDILKVEQNDETWEKARQLLHNAREEARSEAAVMKEMMQARADNLLEKARSSQEQAVEVVLKKISG